LRRRFDLWICHFGPIVDAASECGQVAAQYRDRFQKLLDAAPAEDVPLVGFMVNHEVSVIRMAQREAVGDGSMEHELLPMLLCRMARPAQ
jgi:hypothetical protein